MQFTRMPSSSRMSEAGDFRVSQPMPLAQCVDYVTQSRAEYDGQTDVSGLHREARGNAERGSSGRAPGIGYY